MSFYVARKHRSSRRRPCEGCGFDIAKGEVYAYVAGWHKEGFYRAILHTECEALRVAAYRTYSCEEGLPFSLPEIFSDYGSSCPIEAQSDLNMWRGRFPHAVSRTEHRLRRWLEEDM